MAAHAGEYPPKAWPFQETGHTRGDWWDPVHDQLLVVLFHAARAYVEGTFENRLDRIIPDRETREASRLHLMCGASLIGRQAIDGWLFRPSSVE